jgi:hypothetical protein
MSYNVQRVQEGEEMSETRFTKGKWEQKWTRVYANDRLTFLQYWTETLEDEKEAYANASLVAAAPEMYAMLEELCDNLNRSMKYIISRRVKNGCPIDLARKCSASNIELARRIKALLKKARGEE